jgi:uncharacterized membrane protein YcaP (DUF421 family)
MSELFTVDWKEILWPSVSVAEIFVRGSVTYLMLFLFMRFLLKRETGVIGVADLLVIVLIADAAQNAMTGEYKSITDGAILVVTIIFWNYSLDWLGHRSPAFQRFLRPPPLLLIKDGQMIRRHMRQEMITEEELMSQLRQQGVDELALVKKAYMEGDGRISVIADKEQSGGNKNEDSMKALR